MDLNLTKKNALVCGGSRGIGLAAAAELAELGANITLVARSGDKLAELVHSLHRDSSQNHDFLVADFNNPVELSKRVKALLTKKPIHILLNNTGGPKGGPITEAQVEEFTQAFNNHLVCSHILTKIISPVMIKEGYGRIINVISTSVKEPIPGLGVSNTIRGAVASWAKTLAGELGRYGITVNNVLPGYTQTSRLESIIQARVKKTGKSEQEVIDEMLAKVPMRRFADPSETGSVIAFLASPAGSYVNGTNIPVDGGRTKSL
ncbi:MAG: SDR family oxidoreductase [Saprospirales bacterium]|nr:MAG: SDR family oxidoreductase [Saprospirales bacterium]